MGLFRRRKVEVQEVRAADPALSINEYLRLLQTQFQFNGHAYNVAGNNVSTRAVEAFQTSSPVFALVAVRMLVFSEVRFGFQPFRAGRPGELYGTAALALLERPWKGGTTGDLLSRMEFDASFYGNSYWVVEQGEMVRLDPCYVTIITGSYTEPTTGALVGEKLIGYSYKDPMQRDALVYPAEQVGHYRPIASGQQFLGQSWVASVLPDVIADDQMTVYKQALVRNAATPNLVVTMAPGVSQEQFLATKAVIDAGHTGAFNAFKTLYLGGGVDVKVLGLNFEQLAFKATQGAGETRLASAAGVPVPIVGFSEGLQGSALNAGNYGASRRRFADGTMRPLWRAAVGALETLVPPPAIDSRLWYDDRDVSFLQEDVKDAADIKSTEALTIEALIRSGFDPMSAVNAVRTGDWARLAHSGLVSVQLQPPGAQAVPVRSLLPPLALSTGGEPRQEENPDD